MYICTHTHICLYKHTYEHTYTYRYIHYFRVFIFSPHAWVPVSKEYDTKDKYIYIQQIVITFNQFVSTEVPVIKECNKICICIHTQKLFDKKYI